MSFKPALTYEPLKTVPATMHQQRNNPLRSGKRVECPCCGKLIAPGAVVTTRKPAWFIELGCMIGPAHPQAQGVEQS